MSLVKWLQKKKREQEEAERMWEKRKKRSQSCGPENFPGHGMYRMQGRKELRDNQRERDKENYNLNLVMVETKRRSSLKQSLLGGIDRVWGKDRQDSDQGNMVKREQVKMERQGDRYRRRG